MREGERLDACLVRLGFAGGREKAKELLAAGHVTVNGKTVTKAAYRVQENDCVECSAPKPRYVGRGGYKLEKALELAGLSLTGLSAMDIGSSTGGFTDCMLQHGAARVYAVDVGHDQLHPSLRQDSRVTVLEGTDVRSPSLAAAVPAGSVPFCTVDVSFVSLGHILPSVLPFLTADATLVCLIKPQFEAGKAAVGKHGVVKDRRAHRQVLDRMLMLFSDLSLSVNHLTHSPITGGEGNIEYLAVLHRTDGAVTAPRDTAAIVEDAFDALGGKD